MMAERQGLLDEESAPVIDEHGRLEKKLTIETHKTSSFFFLSHLRLPAVLSSRSISRHDALRLMRQCLIVLVPSFLHPSEDSERPKLRRTAALDGLRGLAAYCVMNFHYLGSFYNMAVGYVADDPNYATWDRLPMIKFFLSGTTMVHIFFVISGYILSLRTLQQMRRKGPQSADGVLKTLSSSTFRRAFRLFGPTSISIFIEMFIIQLGFFEHSRANLWMLEWEKSNFPPREATLGRKFHIFVWVVQRMANPFDWSAYYPAEFDPNLWTIAIEFRCSLALFLIALAICRLYRPWIRRSIVGVLMIILVAYQRWDLMVFLAGMMLADFDVWSDTLEDEYRGGNPYVWGFVALVGIYFGSSPLDDPDRALGFKYISYLGSFVYWEAPYHFAESIGAICLVAAAMHSFHLRRVLESRLIQYLGRISYMLYVCHGPLIRLWAFTIVPGLWSLLSSEPVGKWSTPYIYGVFLGYFFYTPVVFYVADLYTRLIDEKCVELARWIEDKCTKID